MNFFLEFSMKYPPLISEDKILLPIMHIKQGIGGKILDTFIKRDAKKKKYHIEEFLKAQFGSKFKPLRMQGKQVNELIDNKKFLPILATWQRHVWCSFSKVVKGFLGKHRDPNYKELVRKMLCIFEKFKIKMIQKTHYLDSHLHQFPPDCSDFSDENGERTHQDIKVFLGLF